MDTTEGLYEPDDCHELLQNSQTECNRPNNHKGHCYLAFDREADRECMGLDDPNTLTVRRLRKALASLPDDALVYFERITDFYFDPTRIGTPWETLKVPDGQEPSEYIEARDASVHGGRALIFAHY